MAKKKKKTINKDNSMAITRGNEGGGEKRMVGKMVTEGDSTCGGKPPTPHTDGVL